VCVSTAFTTFFPLLISQASQLGVYKAFVDNYKIAVETAEKCSQANIQFQKISEVRSSTSGHPALVLLQYWNVQLRNDTLIMIDIPNHFPIPQGQLPHIPPYR